MDIAQLAEYLQNAAKVQGRVYYSDLVTHFQLPPLDGAWNGHPLSSAFEKLDQQDASFQRAFRTSVVISKENNKPGPGYFSALSRMKGIPVATDQEKDTAWIQQMTAVYAYPWP